MLRNRQKQVEGKELMANGWWGTRVRSSLSLRSWRGELEFVESGMFSADRGGDVGGDFDGYSTYAFLLVCMHLSSKHEVYR